MLLRDGRFSAVRLGPARVLGTFRAGLLGGRIPLRDRTLRTTRRFVRVASRRRRTGFALGDRMGSCRCRGAGAVRDRDVFSGRARPGFRVRTVFAWGGGFFVNLAHRAWRRARGELRRRRGFAQRVDRSGRGRLRGGDRFLGRWPLARSSCLGMRARPCRGSVGGRRTHLLPGLAAIGSDRCTPFAAWAWFRGRGLRCDLGARPAALTCGLRGLRGRAPRLPRVRPRPFRFRRHLDRPPRRPGFPVVPCRERVGWCEGPAAVDGPYGGAAAGMHAPGECAVEQRREHLVVVLRPTGHHRGRTQTRYRTGGAVHQAHGQATAADPGKYHRRELSGEHAARRSTHPRQGRDFDRLQIDAGRIRSVRSDDVGGAIAGGDLQRLHPRVHAHGQRGRLAQHGGELQRARRGQPSSRLRRTGLDRPFQARPHGRYLAASLDEHGVHGGRGGGRAGRSRRRGAAHHTEDAPRQVDTEREHHAQPLLRVVGGRLRLVGQGGGVVTELGRAFSVRSQCVAQPVGQLAY
ncbi:hypothetical protein B7C42_06065 [Nocardia cerradoensis]|uniref:Uncharacterized protein n=1 Tax=Nocardia cerradoensis TaxID=85688 RepID=A0A231GYM5_9NOCA|nr:hypothetical protein B7C42_06065 [Nocardia cerradoensis]